MSITGGCLCGAVRYEISAEPSTMRVCWCKVCQKLAAGNGSANLLFSRAAMTIRGSLTTYTSTADSGNVIDRKFCPTCGTQVLAQTEARPNFVVLRAGTLDDPDIFKPVANIWTSSAPAWACMNEALAKFEKQAPPPPTR